MRPGMAAFEVSEQCSFRQAKLPLEGAIRDDRTSQPVTDDRRNHAAHMDARFWTPRMPLAVRSRDRDRSSNQGDCMLMRSNGRVVLIAVMRTFVHHFFDGRGARFILGLCGR